MTEKIKLSGVPETMLQTLYARAKESKGRGVIHDEKAEEIADRLDYDFSLADKDFESAAYRKTYFRFFKLMCATNLGKICASDHAMNAVDEMSALNRDLKEFFYENGAEYPVRKELEKDTGGYLK